MLVLHIYLCLYVFEQKGISEPNHLDVQTDFFGIIFCVSRWYIFVNFIRRFISFALHVSVINCSSIRLFIQVFLAF